MEQLPIPPELVPDGGQLTPSRFAYMDAFELPIVNADTDANGSQPHIVIVRANHLFAASKDDVAALARHGWRFWVRHAQVTGGVYLAIEPLLDLARPYPFLDSSVQDPTRPDGG
jgi:hypothetical protein